VTPVSEPDEVGEAVDDETNHRFVLEGDHTARLEYRLNGRRLVLMHTEVPAALRDHGIAGRLVRAALTRAETEALTVVPLCPYARDWLEKHPEEARRVTVDWEAGSSPAG
jgi:uncharacterized protein